MMFNVERLVDLNIDIREHVMPDHLIIRLIEAISLDVYDCHGDFDAYRVDQNLNPFRAWIRGSTPAISRIVVDTKDDKVMGVDHLCSVDPMKCGIRLTRSKHDFGTTIVDDNTFICVPWGNFFDNDEFLYVLTDDQISRIDNWLNNLDDIVRI